MTIAIERTRESNDCSVCAVINACRALGVEVDREEVKKHVNYHPTGGFAEHAIPWLAERYGVRALPWPGDGDVQWVPDPRKPGVSVSPFEANAAHLVKGFRWRLRSGMVALAAIETPSGNWHAIAIAGVGDDLVVDDLVVADSLRGWHRAGIEIFRGRGENAGNLQMVGLVWWLWRAEP